MNQLHYEAPEKPHATEELVGYIVSKEKFVFMKHNSVLQSGKNKMTDWNTCLFSEQC